MATLTSHLPPVRVDETMEELIKKAARLQGRTVSNYVRRVVARAVVLDLSQANVVETDTDGDA